MLVLIFACFTCLIHGGGAKYERARTQKENIWVIKGTKGCAGGKARICPLGGPDGPKNINCCVQLTKVIFLGHITIST